MESTPSQSGGAKSAWAPAPARSGTPAWGGPLNLTGTRDRSPARRAPRRIARASRLCNARAWLTDPPIRSDAAARPAARTEEPGRAMPRAAAAHASRLIGPSWRHGDGRPGLASALRRSKDAPAQPDPNDVRSAREFARESGRDSTDEPDETAGQPTRAHPPDGPRRTRKPLYCKVTWVQIPPPPPPLTSGNTLLPG